MSTMTMPSRRPFASLSGSRLRNLTNVKNKQNALPSPMAGPLKRHLPDEFDDRDSENVDPLMFTSPSKKARSFEFGGTSSAKAPLFALTSAKMPAQYVERAQTAGLKRKADEPVSTPSNVNKSSKRIQPSSAPTNAPAGRSPKSKKTGILSRRRMTATPFTRVNPPTFSAGEPSSGMPFSIDAALAGTVRTGKSKSKSTHHKGWQFEIYEDTPDDEMANLMEHSTCTLDISDDESRAAARGDRDNKENIPPADGPAISGLSTQITATRRDMMTDEPRSPLGDLEAKEFYAEGCDASSFIIIGAEEAIDTAEEKPTVVCNPVDLSSPARLRSNAVANVHDGLKDLISQVVPCPEATTSDDNLPAVAKSIKAETNDIQIWESESAKGDEDTDPLDHADDATAIQSVLA